MLLKSLELQGFKSFPDRTRLEFHRGLTAVVGPNGSGKSNISDAIRWVLGEQSSKTLRGSRMEDVIFVGTQNRRSQGYAKVSLVFDNSDRTFLLEEDEVTLSRKYDRSGESEYLLNGKPALLKDVLALLMDTGLSREGYSMIGQGRIEEIVSARSGDRRQIFEEAAGITKLRYRKREALKQLKLAEENCVRLTDILRELEERVEPLKKQAQKAKEYRILDEQRTSLQISLWVEDLMDGRDRLRQIRDELALAQRDYSEQEERLQTVADETQQLYQQLQTAQGMVQKLRLEKEQLFQNRAQAQTRLAVLRESKAQGEKNLARLEEETAAYSMSGQQLLQQRQKRESELSALANRGQELTVQIQNHTQKLARLKEQEDECSALLQQTQERENGLELSRSNIAFTIEALQSRVRERSEQQQELSDQNESQETLLQQFQRQYSETESLLNEIDQKLLELENRRKGYRVKQQSRLKKQEEFEAAFQRLLTSIREREQRKGILEEFEQNMDGFSHSVRFLKKESQRGALTGICGTVAECIGVGERETLAMETALGGALQHIIVLDEGAAKRAIARLKERNAGRATFLLLTAVQGKRLQQPGLLSLDGVIGLASDLISFDERYRPVMEQLLGRTVVAENLDVAVAVAKQYGYRFRIVTLDGQMVQAGGSMTGGSRSKNSGILSRKNEILKLSEGLAKLEEKKVVAVRQRAKLLEQTEELAATLRSLEGEETGYREDRIRAQEEEKRIQERIFSLEEAQKHFFERVAGIEQQKASAEAELSAQKDALQALEGEFALLAEEKEAVINRRADLDAARKTEEEQLQTLRLEQAAVAAESAQQDAFLQSILQRQEEGQERLSRLKEEILLQQQLIKNQESDMEQIQTEFVQTDDEEKRLDSDVAEHLAVQNEAEKQIQERRLTERRLQEKKEQLGLQKARLEERKGVFLREEEKLLGALWEQYQITESEARERALPLSDLTATKKELATVKGKIRALGAVNPGAIEEYQEVSERYRFLQAEMDDIQTSKEGLERMVQQLTSNMQSLFRTAFDQINQHFLQIFRELFGGGSAELRLEDDAEILDCGIEIKVQPPGKIIKQLSALSGGEKAFVAIAIYFAILKVRPAPFCILDEIEAALDDVNVDRFASYLKKMDRDTQFIVITHRRGTMEQADVLYGVTMQEEGVSKLLKLGAADVGGYS